MTIAILILTALVLPLALLYLTLATNEFEKNTKALAAFIQKRYHIEPKKPGDPAKGMKSMNPQSRPAAKA
ncbi:MAG: hypothetical protein JWP91_2001 [Fibrobacteres bacterium]|nr:hypothetical protein [Fibrobacterota bacterium]